jgi:hypothetical protein
VVDQCDARRQIDGGRDLFQVCTSYFNPLDFRAQMRE